MALHVRVPHLELDAAERRREIILRCRARVLEEGALARGEFDGGGGVKVGEEGGARGVQRGGGVGVEGAAVGGCRVWWQFGGRAGEEGG